MNKVLITRRQGDVFYALWDGTRVVEFGLEETDQSLRVGDIFLGRVRDVVKNINAAFVEVSPGKLCFLPLSEAAGNKVRPGDELPVIITKEAVKTKDPVCSRNLSLAGRYLVLVTDRPRIAVSTKITSDAKRDALKALLADLPEKEGVGFIVRTNAAGAPAEELLAEAGNLLAEYRKIKEIAGYRTVFSLLHAGKPAWLGLLRDIPAGTVDEVVTDQEDLYRELCADEETALLFRPEQLRLYRDDYPMDKLFRLEHFLEMALDRRVWLKSGGYLVIEYTEALTVIDVNTGKYEGHKAKEEAILLTNKEAAEEIARALRLRNLSGIILVDFIDMKEEAHREELARVFREALSKDPGRAVLVDFTALGLAEVTRRKIRKPLHEQIKKKNF